MSTSFAASTSMAVAKLGSESAWVSFPEKKRPRDAFCLAEFADSLGYGKDMILVESVLERRSPVAGSAEFDKLALFGRVRMIGVVGGDKFGNVHQNGKRGGFSGQRA